MEDIQGIALSRRFHDECVGPWLARTFPGMPYAAALIGGGSELLGFDDAMSRDHDWGPRLWLCLSEADFAARAEAIAAAFAAEAPTDFLGFPVDARRGLDIQTLDRIAWRLLALAPDEPRDNLGWLGMAEQRLLAFTAGAVFHDDDGRLTGLRERLSWFPRDVWLYKLAGQWRRIAEEQPFVGRTGTVGDDLGSR
jgi:hypothetical protein